MATNAADDLSRTFQALADPTRRAMLARLARGDAGVAELAEPFALSQPTISKHLLVLERAGLVSSGRDAQRRPRTLIAAPLQSVDSWLESYRRFWEARLSSLDDYLKRTHKKPRARTRRAGRKQ